MATSIDMFKKVYVELDVSSSPQQYSLTNDTFYTNSCFLNFSLITNSQTQVVDISVIQKTSVSGTIENTQTFNLNYNNNLLKRNINLFTPYTLIDISYNSLNSILSGFIEKMTMGDTIVVDTSGTTIAVRGGIDISGQRVDISGQYVEVDISGQRVDISGQRVDISGQSILITNDSKTITSIGGYDISNNPLTGINIYQILPKVRSFTLNGFSAGTANNLLAGVGSSIGLLEYSYGKANARTHYIFVPTSSVVRTIKYVYIDTNGNEQTTQTTSITNNTYISLGSMVGINELTIVGNASYGSSDNTQITLANTTSNTKIIAQITNINYHSCGTFTCPNNAIATITSLNAIISTANDYYYLNHWNADGARSTTWVGYMVTSGSNTYIGNGEYGGIGRTILPGETIAFSCVGGSSVNRSVYANIVVKYF